jgi:arylsulfatase A-like enzyme
MPLLTQKGALARDAIYWHFPHYRGEVVPYSIIRKGEWKLIKRYEGKTFELFNLNDDIGEQRDLADKMPEKVKELDARLKEWLIHTNAKMPKPVRAAELNRIE